MPRPPAPANQRAMRRYNLGVVLRAVSAGGRRSRATLALETGLNKSTVSSLVNELIELRLVAERGAERLGVVGRPGLAVEIDPAGAVGLGLEAGVDYLSVHASDLAGAERHARREPADNRGRATGEVLDRLGALARDALAGLRRQGLRAVGATVAVPGLVDAERGILLVAPNLRWTDVPVADEVRARLGDALPVTAENEANLAALAERWSGAGRELADFLQVSGEVGVGAGIVLGGELFRGTRGFGGEIGHMTVDPDGAECACGSRGCLETKVGLEALLAAAGLRADPAAGPAALLGALETRARDGDPAALGGLEEAGRWLGIGAASVVNLLDLQAVVLGGAYATLEPWIADPVRRELRARVLGPGWAVPDVVASVLGGEAAVRGAAALVLRGVLADPSRVAGVLDSASRASV